MRVAFWRPVVRKWGKSGLLALVFVAVASAAGTGVYAALLIGGVQQDSVNLQNGLVGWWKFDGNANDSSGYNNNGTVYNATLTTDRLGYAQRAYTFSGATNSYIDAGTNSSLSFSGDFSLSAWINPTSYHTTGYYGLKNEFLARGPASTYNYALQAADATTVQFIKRTGAEGLQFYTFSNVPSLTNKWTLVTATIHGSTLSLYINGSLFGTQTVGTIGPGANDTLYLGSVSGNSEMAFTGSVDEIRIYNRAINATEAKTLYTQHNSSVKALTGENGLVGWWKLDGNTKDSTPNGNNGTPVNGPAFTTDRKGTVNAAYSFNGNQSITLNGNMFTNSDFTISLWAKPSTVTDTAYHAMVGTQGVTHRSPSLYVAPNGGLHYDSYDSTGATRYSNLYANFFTNTTDWVHIAWVKSGTTYTIYRNGAQYATATAPAGTVWDNPVYEIGHIDNYMAGALDDIRIYKRALSQADVSNLYGSYNSQIAIGGSPGSGVQLGRGLVGDWSMNGNAKDATPYGDNGTVSGASLTADRKGRANSAYSFVAANSNVITSPVAGFPIGSADRTLSAWVYATSYPASNQWAMIDTYGTASNAQASALSISYNGNISFNSQGNDYISSFVLPLNSWHQVAYSITGKQVTIWYDGQPQVGTLGSILSTTSTINNIGRWTGGFYWNGYIDDVRLWNRVLNSAEAKALYTEYR